MLEQKANVRRESAGEREWDTEQRDQLAKGSEPGPERRARPCRVSWFGTFPTNGVPTPNRQGHRTKRRGPGTTSARLAERPICTASEPLPPSESHALSAVQKHPLHQPTACPGDPRAWELIGCGSPARSPPAAGALRVNREGARGGRSLSSSSHRAQVVLRSNASSLPRADQTAASSPTRQPCSDCPSSHGAMVTPPRPLQASRLTDRGCFETAGRTRSWRSLPQDGCWKPTIASATS